MGASEQGGDSEGGVNWETVLAVCAGAFFYFVIFGFMIAVNLLLDEVNRDASPRLKLAVALFWPLFGLFLLFRFIWRGILNIDSEDRDWDEPKRISLTSRVKEWIPKRKPSAVAEQPDSVNPPHYEPQQWMIDRD